MAQGGNSGTYLKSVVALNHYIIHMYEEEHIIYEHRDTSHLLYRAYAI